LFLIPAKMEKVFVFIKVTAALIGVLLLIGLGIRSSKGMPDNAIVYVNDATKTYMAPSLVRPPTGCRRITAGEVRTLGYKPDQTCRDEGAFMQEERSLTGTLLQIIGILKPIPPKWNEDGSWNY